MRGTVAIALIWLGAAGCGRIGFDRNRDAADDSTSVIVDVLRPDANFTTRHWVNRNDGTPGGLFAPRMVFDDARGTIVMYGGDVNTITSAGMWELTGAGWNVLCDPCAPGPRYSHALAYDAIRDRVILFGGLDDGNNPLNDVWEWDGTTWSLRTTTGTPPTVRDRASAMVIDGSLYVVGGAPNNVPTDELFTLSSTGTWSQPGAAGSRVVANYGMPIAYDAVAHQLYAFADDGDRTGALKRDELYRWDVAAGGPWTTVCTACSGLPRNSVSIVFDPDLGLLWMFTGFDGNEIKGTWQLQSNAWQPFDAQLPPARDSVGVAYDPSRHVIVMYGGNGNSCGGGNCAETWELVPN